MTAHEVNEQAREIQKHLVQASQALDLASTYTNSAHGAHLATAIAELRKAVEVIGRLAIKALTK